MSNGSKRNSERFQPSDGHRDSDPLADLRPQSDPRDPRAASLLASDGGADTNGWCLLGLPYDGGIPTRPGARFGPSALRRALGGLTPFDGSRSLQPISDLGDLGLGESGPEAHARIEEASRRLFRHPRRPIFIGGDHGCTGSIIRGLAAATPDPIALLSIDAHLDVREYSEEVIGSGTPFRRALETPICSGTRTAMIGIRPFANSEYYTEWVRAQGIRIVSVDDVSRIGARAVAEEVLGSIAPNRERLYLSIDLDAADSAYAPGVSAPGTGGLTSREVFDIVATIAAAADLVGADIMELSPPYDLDDRTARLAARLLLEVVRSAPER